MEKAKKIFIFDDNYDILELCTLILEEAGYEIKTSVTSNKVSEQVAAYMPDIIFMDNWLPDIGGIEATKELKANPELRHIPIIFFSANSDVSDLAKQAGADGFLPKPFDILALEGIVEAHLVSNKANK